MVILLGFFFCHVLQIIAKNDEIKRRGENASQHSRQAWVSFLNYRFVLTKPYIRVLYKSIRWVFQEILTMFPKTAPVSSVRILKIAQSCKRYREIIPSFRFNTPANVVTLYCAMWVNISTTNGERKCFKCRSSALDGRKPLIRESVGKIPTPQCPKNETAQQRPLLRSARGSFFAKFFWELQMSLEDRER